MSKPIAVLVSDIHFSVQNLELATISLQDSLALAEQYRVPLIIAGDLNDSKAIIRGEVANRLITILQYAQVEIFILIGNHDLLNEKGLEHSLNFLRPYADIIQSPINLRYLGLYLIPYHSSLEVFGEVIKNTPSGSTIICHQGVQGAFLGDYIQDKSSVHPDILKDYKVFSGHYHRHQQVGTVTYIGNPYTMSFGEANDGPKGCLILNDDNSYKLHEFHYRKHIVIECMLIEMTDEFLSQKRITICDNDLVWLKVSGSKSMLELIDKKYIGEKLLGHSNFKLDLIPLEATEETQKPIILDNRDLLDHYIERLEETEDQKSYLKTLWRSL